MPRLSPADRLKIHTWTAAGKTDIEISALLHCHPNTVATWRRRAADLPLQDLPRPGRPRCTTRAEDRRIRELATSGTRRGSLRSLAERSSTTAGNHPSHQTVGRRLHSAGIQQLLPQRRALLTVEYKRKRLLFARAMKRRRWDDAVFHDERKWILGPPKKRVWRKRGEIYVESTVKHPLSINSWAGFGIEGKTAMVLFKENMNAAKLSEILRRHFFPICRTLITPHRMAVVSFHDNDPKYRSHLVTDLLDQKKVLDAGQPPGSPDVNPMENLYGIVAKAVAEHRPRTKAGFSRAIKMEWNKVKKKVLRNLVNSMKNRLKDVRQAHGGHTTW